MQAAINSLMAYFDDFTSWIKSWFDYYSGFFTGLVTAAIEKASNFLPEMWESIKKLIYPQLQSLVSFIHLTDVTNVFNSLTGTGFGYFLNVFGVNQLVMVFLSAYVIRFTIRRIPFIG